MRFTDNAELTAANMTDTDILAGTDVSAQTDKKFSLAGLADWFLNRFTGLSLAGQNQSVKAALDGLNSNVVGQPVTLTAGSNVTIAYQMAYVYGNVLFVHARWTATTALTNYQVIFTTGINCRMSWNTPLMSNGNVPVPNYGLYADTGNNSVRAAGAIPAGTYRTFLAIPVVRIQ